MKVTSVKLQLESPRTDTSSGDTIHSPVRARGDVILDGQFVVHEIKVLEGSKGLFVGMPAQLRDKETKRWKDYCHPIDKELKKQIDAVVLAEYYKLVQKQSEDKKKSEETKA